MAAREAHITGRAGVAELTATVQACAALWEGGLCMADVSGTDLLDGPTLALIGGSLALRGESVLLIDPDGLIPVSDWDLTTRRGKPRAYRLSLPEVGGGSTQTALASEVLHIRIGTRPFMPWAGRAPLARAQLTAELMAAVESALKEVYQDAPLGSQIAHLPDGAAEDTENMRQQLRGRRGATMVIEGQAHAVAAGMHPVSRAPDQLSPDLSKSMTRETLAEARDAICAAYGVLPGLFNRATTGPMVREAQRHLAQWQLMPVAGVIAHEASDKLGVAVQLDVMRPLQAFDTGGRARALSAIIKAMAEAEAAGIDPGAAMRLVDWQGKETE
jgi:hypothetical protein